MTAPGRKKSGSQQSREFAQFTAQLFIKLASRGAYLKPPHCPESGRGEYELFTEKPQGSAGKRQVPSALVDRMLKAGWIRHEGDKLILADEGVYWLRRHLSGADPFTEQHQVRNASQRLVDGVRRPVIVNDGESPLGWLASRKDRNGKPLISVEQFEAGEQLRSDFERARMRASVTSNWETSAPSRRSRRSAPAGPSDISDAAIAARRCVEKALQAVGPELAGVLIDVCCHLLGLEDAEHARGWPKRSGKVILLIALSQLARHYGIDGEKRKGQGSAKPVHWGTDDYKPSLEQWQ